LRSEVKEGWLKELPPTDHMGITKLRQVYIVEYKIEFWIRSCNSISVTFCVKYRFGTKLLFAVISERSVLYTGYQMYSTQKCILQMLSPNSWNAVLHTYGMYSFRFINWHDCLFQSILQIKFLVNLKTVYQLWYFSSVDSSPFSEYVICLFVVDISTAIPITVVARFKAWTVFSRSNAGIVGSNPTHGMDICIVCIYSVFVLFCVSVEALRLVDLSSKKSYLLRIGSKNWKSGQGPTKRCRAIIIIIIIII
jgi:hypothetical protein